MLSVPVQWLVGGVAFLVAGLENERGKQDMDRQKKSPNFARHQQQYELPLYDESQYTMSESWRPYRWIPDLMHTIYLAIGLLLGFIDFLHTIGALSMIHWKPYSFPFFVTTISFLYVLRIRLCAMTMLPKCRIYNQMDEFKTFFTSKWAQKLHQGWFVGLNGHGHDLAMSGHCLMVWSNTFYWTYFHIFSTQWLVLAWFMSFVMAYLIILTRCHYRSDVYITFFITVGMFHLSCTYLYPLFLK